MRSLQGHAPEVVALHALDAVKFGEPVVHKRVVRVQKFQHAAVLLGDVREEQLGFFCHRRAESVVELREKFLVRRGQFQVADLQPLSGEIVHQRFCLAVFQHASDLRLQIFPQHPAFRQSEQFVVRHAAPEEIGQARRQREFVHRMDQARVVRFRLQFAAKQEIG